MKKDPIYNDMRLKATMNWLDDMSKHDDLEVRAGVAVTKDYLAYLQNEIKNLEESNALKDQYLKKLKEKSK